MDAQEPKSTKYTEENNKFYIFCQMKWRKYYNSDN